MHSIRQYCQRVPGITNRLQFSSSSPEIVIAPRVERGPTDILAALAGTVNKDMTAPHYRYHDDPYLIPYKLGTKREFILSRESGKNAARFIMSKHPDLFEHNRIEAEPPITAFQPRAAYNRDNVTVELLDNLVKSFQVQDSIIVFELLWEKNKEIPEDLKQSLLELVAFYNESEAVEEGDQTRGVLPNQSPWITDGFVAGQYSEGGVATPEQRLAMLMGQGKHGGKVWQLIAECKANGDKIPVEAYNFSIERTNQSDGLAKAVDSVKEVLVEMRDTGLAPTNGTLCSILSLLSQFSKKNEYEASCRRALDFLAEFRVLGVEFSLGVYKNLIDVYVPVTTATDKKTPAKRSPILNDILNKIEDSECWPARHPDDLWFFPVAMKVASVQNNFNMAWRLNNFLNSGKNALLLNDFQMETVYYTNFLNCILQNDSFDKAMELYYDIVPNTCTPMYNVYSNLLSHIHTNAALQHLPKIWEDILMSDFGQASRENQYLLTNHTMQVLLANDPSLYEFTGMSEVYVTIAEQIYTHLETGKADRKLFLRFNNLAANICDSIILVSLREGSFDLAAKVIKFCVAEKNVMPGTLKDDALAKFITACVDLGYTENAMEAIEYCVDISNPQALTLGNKISSELELDSEQRDYMNKLFATYSKWVNI